MPLQSSQGAAKVQRTKLEIAACVLVLAGASLAIGGALGPWLVVGAGGVGAESVGLLQTCKTLPLTSSVSCAVNTSPGALAGGACLLLGFVFGLFDFFAVVARCCRVEAAQHPSCAMSRLGFVVGSFVFSLAGTVVASSVKSTGALSFQQAVSSLSGVAWGPAFGCSVAAVVLQFIALGLALGGMCFKAAEAGFDERGGVEAHHPLARV